MKAIILAGGEGKRLRPLTNDKPKPLLEVGGKPIIEWQIEWLKRSGVDSFVIAAGYMKDKLISHLGTGSRWGVDINFVTEDEPLGTAGAIKSASSIIKNEREFIVANGDIITNLDVKKLVLNENIAAISLTPLRSSFGIVVTNGDAVTGFDEKPLLKDYWLNAGIYLMSGKIFGYLPDKGSIERETFPQLAREGLLSSVKFETYWRSVDSIKDFEEVSVDLSNNTVY